MSEPRQTQAEADQADQNAAAEPAPRPPLTDAAKRALAEAEERRKAADAAAKERPRELGGRDGPEPTRYGDWEKNGVISDF